MRIFNHWSGVALGLFWGIAEGDNGTIQDGNCGEKFSEKIWKNDGLPTWKKGPKADGVVDKKMELKLFQKEQSWI